MALKHHVWLQAFVTNKVVNTYSAVSFSLSAVLFAGKVSHVSRCTVLHFSCGHKQGSCPSKESEKDIGRTECCAMVLLSPGKCFTVTFERMLSNPSTRETKQNMS